MNPPHTLQGVNEPHVGWRCTVCNWVAAKNLTESEARDVWARTHGFKNYPPDDLDKRIYDMMGRKLYEARRARRDFNGMELMLDAMDDCYALLATLFDPPIKKADDEEEL